MASVQVETAADTDSGKNVGSIETSDCMTYDVNKATADCSHPKRRRSAPSTPQCVSAKNDFEDSPSRRCQPASPAPPPPPTS
jgi:hypothetical protein